MYRLRLETELFLARHWQREHLFIPGGLAPFSAPADADALAGLAMEADADSRIVSAQDGHWRQQRGPFQADDFQRGGSWTLLVQGVDQFWEQASLLRRSVEFLPSWRLDDVMMSYASDGGSAGPHFDNYDVFIIQGEGQRRWQVGGFCDSGTPLLDNTDLRLLAAFEPEQEYLMRAGDVLYLPPGCAHYGTSVGESTSFSIGFRAPRMSDLMARWLDNRLAAIDDDWLFRDPGREPVARAGEISAHDLLRARQQLLSALEDDDPRWFGEAITAAADATLPPDSLSRATGRRISLAPAARLAWLRAEGELLVFSQGSSRSAPLEALPMLESLCADDELALDSLHNVHDGIDELLDWLYEEGAILTHD